LSAPRPISSSTVGIAGHPDHRYIQKGTAIGPATVLGPSTTIHPSLTFLFSLVAAEDEIALIVGRDVGRKCATLLDPQ
jgi:hypothetical protein